MKKILIALMGFALIASAQAQQFTRAETTGIQTIVHDYLVNHPEILVQMSKKLQEKQYDEMQARAVGAIKANSASIFTPNHTQVAGNPDGKVTLVEFFDYQCVHCYNLHKQGVIQNLIKANSDLRVVYKEFPIFGAPSIYASKAAMAAGAQGKYIEMRDAIFGLNEIEGKLKQADIDKAAKKVGLNMDKYHAFIKGNEGKSVIDADYKLAQALGIQGTPSFIVAPTPKTGNADGKISFIPGLVSPEKLQEAVTAAQ